jgi:hypothetical protein
MVLIAFGMISDIKNIKLEIFMSWFYVYLERWAREINFKLVMGAIFS